MYRMVVTDLDGTLLNLSLIHICYLGFTWEELGLSKPSAVEIDCTALLDDMLDGGIFGQNDMNRVHKMCIRDRYGTCSIFIIRSTFQDSFTLRKTAF